MKQSWTIVKFATSDRSISDRYVTLTFTWQLHEQVWGIVLQVKDILPKTSEGCPWKKKEWKKSLVVSLTVYDVCISALQG